ncbi:MAG: hypothetical protein GXP42_05690 [Chloroflexi bacterium]|nr:hypothetical protein [Chloroflexota bacterium]
MRDDVLERMQKWLLRLFLLTLVLMAVVVGVGVQRGSLNAARVSRVLGQITNLPAFPKVTVALIAGHRGSDSGATCRDGLTEVSITQKVAQLTAEKLREQAVDVAVLDEYDSVLRGLQADVLVSIHVDSCIDLTGFKVAAPVVTMLPDTEARLVQCLEQEYAAATGLSIHSSTVSRNMTRYHAFQRIAPTTPGAIIEIGFLGGDRELLTERPELAAEGVARGIICFLDAKPAEDEGEDDGTMRR